MICIRNRLLFFFFRFVSGFSGNGMLMCKQKRNNRDINKRNSFESFSLSHYFYKFINFILINFSNLSIHTSIRIIVVVVALVIQSNAFDAYSQSGFDNWRQFTNKRHDRLRLIIESHCINVKIMIRKRPEYIRNRSND